MKDPEEQEIDHGDKKTKHNSCVNYLLIATNATFFTLKSTAIKASDVHPLLITLSPFIFTVILCPIYMTYKKTGWGQTGKTFTKTLSY